MISTISAQELLRLHGSGRSIELIDVRTPAEFQEAHVSFARNVPLDRLDSQTIQGERDGRGQGPLYVICRSGSRGKQACEKLLAAGMSQVINVEGGTMACDSAGVPMIRGKKAMSLERQVRIAAGGLVVLGAVLGAWVHPYGILLAAFVGLGLMYSGITDTCGMAMLIARMPWNQVSTCSRTSSSACRAAAILLAAMALTADTAWAQENARESLPAILRRVQEQSAILVDVRERDEWDEAHLRGARLLSLSVLQQGLGADELSRILPRDKVIYLHCAAGARCVEAARLLKRKGFETRPIKAGYDELIEAGFPEAKR